jgi:hypothetical protein
VFDSAVRAVQRAFYYQRAFTEIDAEHAQGPWVHGSDAALALPGVVKGWHDAGDFSLYSASTNSALFWLPSAFADFSPNEDDTGHSRVRERCARPARRGAVGPGVAACGPRAERRLPKHDLPGGGRKSQLFAGSDRGG